MALLWRDLGRGGLEDGPRPSLSAFIPPPQLTEIANPQLLLGDSVVRDLIRAMCDAILREKATVHLDTTQEFSEKTRGWLCEHETYNFRMINGFVYGACRVHPAAPPSCLVGMAKIQAGKVAGAHVAGRVRARRHGELTCTGMTNYSAYPSDLVSSEWPAPPWNFEDRIPDFVKQYAPYEPEVVMVNSGAWDMKFLYRRDVSQGRVRQSGMWDMKEVSAHSTGRARARDRLTKGAYSSGSKKRSGQADGQLLAYGERLRQFLRLIREAYPTQKLLWLQLHPFDTEDIIAKWNCKSIPLPLASAYRGQYCQAVRMAPRLTCRGKRFPGRSRETGARPVRPARRIEIRPAPETV